MTNAKVRWARYNLGCAHHKMAPMAGESSLCWEAVLEGVVINQVGGGHLGDVFMSSLVELLTGDFYDRYGCPDGCSCVVVPLTLGLAQESS